MPFPPSPFLIPYRRQQTLLSSSSYLRQENDPKLGRFSFGNDEKLGCSSATKLERNIQFLLQFSSLGQVVESMASWNLLCVVLLLQIVRGLSYWCITQPSISLEAVFKEVQNLCSNGEELSCIDIQEPGPCFFGGVYYLRSSYVFNAIYQRNPSPDNCIFGGLTFLTNIDPSTGSCVFHTSTAYMPDVVSAASPPPPPLATTTSLTSPPPATTTPFIFWIAIAGIATISVGFSIGVWKIYSCCQNIEINIEMNIQLVTSV